MPTGAPLDSPSGQLLSAVQKFKDLALSWHSATYQPTPDSGEVTVKAMDLHATNFSLWHHEDAVRRPGIDDHAVACTKRLIDALNAKRNSTVEDIDELLLQQVNAGENAPLHTETPGRIVDRLSVLALRIAHTNRPEQYATELAVLNEQYEDLFGGLQQLLTHMHDGAIRVKLYRQFKSATLQNECTLFEATAPDR
ncbi:DUF4254 domain-containing protein [Mycobacterium sp. 050134]|uniref:DUF4254 domain-containing protein n=1 Tax=Mycobacterium sp. 050134 TaxID=3096111 RepID=UPI002ED7E1D8